MFEKGKSEMNWRFIHFTLPVFVFYMIGGIMYGVMEARFREYGIETHILFYALMIVVAGVVYDRVGRKAVALTGLIAISASILLFPAFLLHSAYLVQSAFAFIDVFAMMIWTDIGSFGREAAVYGIGMLFITFPLYFGFVLSAFFPLHVNTLFALILLVVSAFVIGISEEPEISPEEYMRWLVR